MNELLLLTTLRALDGGTRAPAPLSPEDEELVKDLELLENLDGAGDLELLQELSVDR